MRRSLRPVPAILAIAAAGLAVSVAGETVGTAVSTTSPFVPSLPAVGMTPGPADSRFGTGPDGSGSCQISQLAWQGEALTDGGTLSPLAFTNPATINQSSLIAFYSKVDGSPRNQGIFVADSHGVRTIVRGCGSGGGSGDPGTLCGDLSPIGGVFSGLFDGSLFVPGINQAGDVLFLADVFAGAAPRGLFLYRAATGQIAKVAAVGDRAPGIVRARFSSVGVGSLNNAGEVVFLATTSLLPSAANIYRWKAGAVSRVVSVGDRVPGGGFFANLGGETVGFRDGTFAPVGPAPDIDDDGRISFRALVSGGLAGSGEFVSSAGRLAWYAKVGDATPIGGVYQGFFAPVLGHSGEIAFYAEVERSPGVFTAGWFAGRPGSWRSGLTFEDRLDGDPIERLAVSRNPMQPLDEDGRLLLWCSVLRADGTEQEKLVVRSPDGGLTTIASQGDATPLGGQIGRIMFFPSIVLGKATISSDTVGAPGGVLSAHMVSDCSTVPLP